MRTMETIERLAKALDVTPMELQYGEVLQKERGMPESTQIVTMEQGMPSTTYIVTIKKKVPKVPASGYPNFDVTEIYSQELADLPLLNIIKAVNRITEPCGCNE